MVRIVTVYPGADGESRLIDVTTDQFAEIVNHIGEGPTRLNRSPSPSVDDYHNASRVQYVVHLAGTSEIEVADGTIKRLHPGDVLIAQDTTGHGHITRGIGDEPRVSLAVPLEKVHGFRRDDVLSGFSYSKLKAPTSRTEVTAS